MSGPVLIGFESALLAILSGAIFHFRRRERRAECLGLIEDCEKLIAEFADRLGNCTQGWIVIANHQKIQAVPFFTSNSRSGHICFWKHRVKV